jgi:hypothetical protein
MVAAIRQNVMVQAGGVVEVRSPELIPGARAEVIVLVEQPLVANVAPGRAPADWRRFAGALNTGDPRSSDNDHIDADLAKEYGSAS